MTTNYLDEKTSNVLQIEGSNSIQNQNNANYFPIIISTIISAKATNNMVPVLKTIIGLLSIIVQCTLTTMCSKKVEQTSN